VQHPVYPGAAVAPSRAHERRPELVRVADRASALSPARIRTSFLIRTPALRAGPAALRLSLPALLCLSLPALLLGLPELALLGPLALHLGLPALLLGFRTLLTCRFAVLIRHAASRSRWSS
jgi:hypothetical protein